MSHPGGRIRERRKQLGWTQKELCRMTGMSTAFLSELESGKRNVGSNYLYKVAQALGVSADHLMGAGGQAPPSSANSDPVRFPAALAEFAREGGLPFGHVLTLLDLQRVLLDGRKDLAGSLEGVDWKKFYERLKEFL
jgi:transcriptional regulator with XRE-family HTH domain